jgi:hypothetical protein
MNIFLHWVLLSTKMRNRTLLFHSILLKHGRHFDCWNQPLNMSMRVCYSDCYEDGLCCYLVVHLENVLRPLHLFYFHLWPIYWLCLVLILWRVEPLLCNDREISKYTKAVCRQRFGKHVPAVTDTNATMVQQQRLCFLRGPCREVIRQTRVRA